MAKRLGVALAIAVVGVGLPFFWAAGGWPFPAESDWPIVHTSYGSEAIPGLPKQLRVITYNIHYGIGHEHDGHARVAEAEIKRHLDRIGEIITALQADVVLLQEVDFDSARTSGINEMEWIARASGMRYMAAVPTWVKNYLPYPPWPPSLHYGRMDSGQAVLSRYPITSNHRVSLPRPSEWNVLYRAFYLARAIQHVTVDVSGTKVEVINVHNESNSVPNRQEHAEILRDYVRGLNAKALVMAGDFNAAPPEATKKSGFVDEPELDMRQDHSITTLRELNLNEVIPPTRYRVEEAQSLTFPAKLPTRRLDYLFYSGAFTLDTGNVQVNVGPVSDHLPIFAALDFVVPAR